VTLQPRDCRWPTCRCTKAGCAAVNADIEFVTRTVRGPDGAVVIETYVPCGPTNRGVTPLAERGSDGRAVALLIDHTKAWGREP